MGHRHHKASTAAASRGTQQHVQLVVRGAELTPAAQGQPNSLLDRRMASSAKFHAHAPHGAVVCKGFASFWQLSMPKTLKQEA